LRATLNLWVEGSIPSRLINPFKKKRHQSLVPLFLCDRIVTGFSDLTAMASSASRAISLSQEFPGTGE
jgi:hypothetical protein